MNSTRVRLRVAATGRLAACLAVLIVFASRVAADGRVSVDRESFNPSVGEAVSVTVKTPTNARISITVLDRDGYVTRRLADNAPAGGIYVARWDGRDSTGTIVADEAYSFQVDVKSSDGTWSYFPAAQAQKTYAVQARQYSRRGAALMYDLAAPARVHAQAGSAALDQKTKSYDGPVLKTLVNREPRPKGAIVESWNGLDESASIYVPDLPEFVTAILASELPENAVIAFGNRSRTFLDVARTRTGASLLPPTVSAAHMHHQGLETLDDVSPALVITPVNARWDGGTKSWHVTGEVLRLELKLEGPTAGSVSRHPGRIVVFVDYRQTLERQVRTESETIDIPLPGGSRPHAISVNWQSAYGPLAANSLRVTGISQAQPAARESR